MLEKTRKKLLRITRKDDFLNWLYLIICILFFVVGFSLFGNPKPVEADPSIQKHRQMERLIRAEEQQARALQDILREMRRNK